MVRAFNENDVPQNSAPYPALVFSSPIADDDERHRRQLGTGAGILAV